MAPVLNFFIRLAPFIFLLLTLGALVGLRQLLQARAEMRGSAYGLEREIAQRHTNQAISALVLVGVLALAEFTLMVFLVPNIPGLSRLATATMNPLTTPTSTFPLTALEITAPGTPGLTPTAMATGCIIGQIDITSPKAGDQIQGSISLKGTANVPNFGFYKYEFAPIGSDAWATILADRKPVQDGDLGNWDTSAIPTGDYQLRLVVTNNKGNELPACIIPLRIKAK
jgi:hypothetical protein